DLDSSDLVEEERNEKFYEELREQLKAYQLAKARAQALINTPQLGVDTFTRIDKKSLLPTPEMLQEADDVNSLGLLFASLVKRIGGLAKSYKVRFENVTVVSYMMKIVDLLKVKPNSNNFTFKSLYQNLLSISNTNKNKNPADHKLTFREKTVVITSFGAILELVKRGIVNVTQENEAEDIKLQMRLKDVETSSLSTFQSDFDSSSDDKNSLSQNQLDSDAERFSSTDNKILKIANS
ncbi:MAG: hypothetical protein KBC84_06355, partial [Proteobacteria bacterium]|nr:hypothetical protein [Pseudomonadota bacterium]